VVLDASAIHSRDDSVRLRPLSESDAERCGSIVFRAFGAISERHGFPADFPSEEFAIGIVSALARDPRRFAVAAELDGHVVGSNFLDERDEIVGVGPISVDPQSQGHGVGRRLMEAVMERGQRAPGIRLLQDAHNPVSMALYASLGFEIKEPVVRISGEPSDQPDRELEVRPLEVGDLGDCDGLCRQVHGFARGNELRDAIRFAEPWVATREDRLVAYAASLSVWAAGHGVAESVADMRGLICGAYAATGRPVDFVIPTRQAGLFRWSVQGGLRVVKPMSLMAMGEYREPAGCWFPSVLY
jgi:ribosomal protein S18 acetylase RimI-like enzyme